MKNKRRIKDILHIFFDVGNTIVSEDRFEEMYEYYGNELNELTTKD